MSSIRNVTLRLKDLADKVGISESKPRTSRIQRNRANPPSIDPSDYFKKVATIPLLDYLNEQVAAIYKDFSTQAYYPTRLL